MTRKPFDPIITEAQGIEQAILLRDYAAEIGHNTAFEVVRLGRPEKDGSRYAVQPAGMHRLFKTHKLVFVAEN